MAADAVVGVGDGLVGDACVDERHAQGLVAQHRSDRFEAHAAVDGLGRERVTELMGVDVADPGCFRDPVQDAGDDVAVEGPPVEDQ
ncbi:MAG: hypothetical protein R2697_15500 [Ilumatobacteraceae bacterium]